MSLNLPREVMTFIQREDRQKTKRRDEVRKRTVAATLGLWRGLFK